MTAPALAFRAVPPVLLARRPQRMVERSLMCYRRTWMILVSGFFEPLFYLLSIRVGVGELIGTVEVGGRQVEYAAFVAPALLASSAMNGAVFDSTMNIFHRMKYARIYDHVLATPMTPGDVALGEITWAVLRGQIYAVTFIIVMWAMGLVESVWILAGVPICALIGYAFASVGMACTTWMRSWADNEWVLTATMPMFLFSATFFPLSAYDENLRWLVQLSPLYHGVSLLRMANSGTASWSIVGHVAVLVAMTLVGLWVAGRRIAKLLCA
jgi:lipooligosaccharide transport system permease protein